MFTKIKNWFKKFRIKRILKLKKQKGTLDVLVAHLETMRKSESRENYEQYMVMNGKELRDYEKDLKYHIKALKIIIKEN